MEEKKDNIVSRTLRQYASRANKIISKYAEQPDSDGDKADSKATGGAALLKERGKDVSLDMLTSGGVRLGADDNFDSVVKKSGLAIYDEMMTDAQVRGSINEKRFAVTSSDWIVKPSSDDDESSKEQAYFIEHCLNNCKGSVIGSAFAIMNYLVHGYSISEKNLMVIEGGEFAGKYGLKEIRNKNPNDYMFAFDEFGNVKELYLKNMYGAEEKVPLDKFIIATYQSEYGRVYGRSDLRAAYKHWWSNNIILKFRNMYLETCAIPIREGTVPAGDEGKAEEFRDLLESFMSNAVIVHPEAMKVNFITDRNSPGSAFDDALDYNNKLIDKAIKCQALTSSDGDGTGSYALGGVHRETMDDVVTFLRKDIAEIINESLVRWLIDINYPGQTEYPQFIWHPRKTKLNVSSVDDLKKLTESGILLNSDVNYLRDKLDLPWKEIYDNDDPFEAPKEPSAIFSINPPTEYAKELKEKEITHFAKPQLKEAAMTESEIRIGGVSFYEKLDQQMIDNESKIITAEAPILQEMMLDMQKQVKQKVLYDPNKNRAAINDLALNQRLLNQYNSNVKSWMTGIVDNNYVAALRETKNNPKSIPTVSSDG